MLKHIEIKTTLVLLISVVLLYPLSSPEAWAQPMYTEVEVTSLDGDIYVNPEYIGKVRSIRTINRSGLLGDRVEIEVRILTDDWRKISLPPVLSGTFGVIISGERGILKISLPGIPANPDGSDIYTINKLLIEFGTLNTTFVFPAQSIIEPSKYQIGLLDNRDKSFVSGKVIVMKSNELVADFQNLPSAVVNSEGMLHVSITNPGGSFINADIPAWGYNIFVPETDVGAPAPITAEVFGLDPGAKIRFDFSSLADQVINPSTKILTVKEINSGAPVATITTNRGGAQPLTVTVKRVE